MKSECFSLKTKKTYGFLKNFSLCGLTGLLIEVTFTSLLSLRNRDFSLKASTSPIMFPIYGCAAIILPISRLIKRASLFVRGIIYMLSIYTIEFISGTFLKKYKLCPWNYNKSRSNICSVIRLDYAPCWFITGLFYEWLLKHRAASKK